MFAAKRLVTVLALLGCLAAPAAWADDDFDLSAPVDTKASAEKIAKANQYCYDCHTEAGVKTPPQPNLNLSKLGTMLVDPAEYDRSNHTGTDCKDCHVGGFGEFPHKDNVPTKQCAECHKRTSPPAEEQFKKSVHHQQHPGKFTCESCHDTHKYRVAAKIGAPREIVSQDNAMCIDCHESEVLFSIFKPVKRLPALAQSHAWLPSPSMHWAAVRCVDCHTPLNADAVSHEVLPKDKAEKNCISCHSTESSLRTRLYRHLAQEERVNKAGFINSVILSDAYVVGATRNELLDKASFVVLGGLVLALVGHGALRIIGALRRRKGQ